MTPALPVLTDDEGRVRPAFVLSSREQAPGAVPVRPAAVLPVGALATAVTAVTAVTA